MTEAEPSRRTAVVTGIAGASFVAGAIAFAVASLFASAELGGLGGDDAEYVLLARGIRDHGTYLTSWGPGAAAPHTLYPPVLPLLLAPFVGGAGGSLAAVHLVLAAAGGVAVALLARLFAMRGLPPLAAALGALAPALSPFWIRCSSDVLSELPCLAFAAASLLALEVRDGERRTPRRAALAAACAALAFLTRTAAIALVPWVALELVLPRRGGGRAGWIAAGGLVAAVAAWFVYGALAATGDSYFRVLASGEGDAAGSLAARVWDAVVHEYLPGLPSFVFPRGGAVWDACGALLWCLAGTGVVLGVLRARRLRTPEAFALTTLAMLCVWSFRDPRFGVPVVPILVLLALEAVHALARRWTADAWRASVVVSVVAAACVLSNAVHVGAFVLPRSRRATPPVEGVPPGTPLPNVAAFHETWTIADADWAVAADPVASYLVMCRLVRTDPSAPAGPILASNPRVASLLTGRGAMCPVEGETVDALLARMRASGVELIVADSFRESRSSLVREILRRHGDRVEVLGRFGGTMLVRLHAPR